MAITVRKAKTERDLELIFNIRQIGDKRPLSKDGKVTDNYDHAPHATLLLAEDDQHQAVGTMRILDRRCGKIELDEYIEVNSFLSNDEKSCIEMARLWIPKHLKSKLIKFLLWKALFQYCKINQINTVLASIRPEAVRFYQRSFFFESVGTSGIYFHQSSGSLEYHTYKCNIPEIWGLMRRTKHPLYDFFCVEDHPNIKTEGFRLSLSELKMKEVFRTYQNIGLGLSPMPFISNLLP